MSTFIVHLAFKPDRRDDLAAVRPKHREYLTALHEQGKLVTAGRWADDEGALLVYDVADEGELREVLAADPYTPAGVYEVVELREWRPIFPLTRA